MPAQLTAPSAAYRRHTWLAVAGLLTFAVAYLALLGWFTWTAWRLFHALIAGEGGDGFSNVLVGSFAAFLAIFMAKGLVFFKRSAGHSDLELKAADQPELFAFLHRLADEARAPRPHRVFLSPRVNAGVFYDLSLFNLIVPSKKNLDIGLALVNVLNLGEFKAVLAHEFGHFAQRTMAVGRWVYVAHQIASQLIARRDALDSLLGTLSRLDIRIAWIGWALSLIVWAIRSLVESAFRIVVLSERALSREMEYQADLVAASLTGSDALVHALHRLGAADDAWNRALAHASREYQRGRAVDDLFAVQTRVIEQMRRVAPHATFGEPPTLPDNDRHQHRVFRSELARPPQMWSTHPSNSDRESNLKRQYVAARIDERPATLLLRDADALKRRLSHDMLVGEPPAFAPIEETLKRLDAEFDRRSLDLRYRGSYLGRSFVREVEAPAELFTATANALGDAELLARIGELYAPRHGDDLRRLDELAQERDTLEATHLGHLRAPGGEVHWRGRTLSVRQLKPVIKELDAEIAPLREAVREHDRQCRSLHLIAARRVAPAWERVLASEVELLHYCEHTEANLRDLHGLFVNTLQVVTADNRVSSTELRRLIGDADRLHDAIGVVYDRAGDVVVDDTVATRLEHSFAESLGKLGLGVPTAENINQWLKVVDGWVNHTCGELMHLRAAALESLLANEDHVTAWLASGEKPDAPTPCQVPHPYPVLVPGKERKRQTRLGWWDRFQTADGVVATVARVVVAGGIVGGVLMLGMQTGTATVSLYNGLSRTVVVEIDGQTVELAPQRATTLSVEAGTAHEVVTRTPDGDVVETFRSEKMPGTSHFLYNVAGATPLVQWTAIYGTGQQAPPQHNLGALRWSASAADHVFEEPPQSISTQAHDNGGTRTVLSAAGDLMPQQQIALVPGSDEQRELIRAHARWDDPQSRHLSTWLWLAKELPGGVDGIVTDRLRRDPHDVATLRAEQALALANGPRHDEVCARQRALAQKEPAFAGYAYLAARCTPEGPDHDAAFLAGQQRWPDDPWFALASGYVYAQRQQWPQADTLWSQALRTPATAENVALELARVKRITDVPAAQWQSLVGQSSVLAQMLELPSAATRGTPYEAYAWLEQGDLYNAVKQAEGDATLYTHVLRQAAASDGASPELVQRALALLPTEGIDPGTLWSSWALALREGQSDAGWREKALADPTDEGMAVARFVDAVRAGASQTDAEAALGNVMPRTRGLAYAMAVTLRGDACPLAWREASKKLLFTPERPYFR
ncbi:M48 family metallopeptidase [Lysobacter sp. LF1]|uniref:M48 family metallopeptidase n=1 Tax=Lysobacter stagni TaxID=3045172 RepID=A0ABT6XDT4_9GAMM|nr:M48 family metallopeptidase [Lysobacter sp. LF1]MDI9238216.1 M48 family metallopeptidase [Lysobacter sp. LF1]